MNDEINKYCNEEELEDLKSIIDEMQCNIDYDFAEEFVGSIANQIDSGNPITKKQYKGIMNIYYSVENR